MPATSGSHAATGEIVAYIDDDAYPDPDWLRTSPPRSSGPTHAGIGGPEHPAAGRRPGGRGRRQRAGRADPRPALRPGRRAHPGLQHGVPTIGARWRSSGFDPQFRTAGRRRGLCWRLRERGWTLGFHPGAVVWHHRRNSVRMYWKQQKGYGRAEALLERKWPEKYNQAGHVNWAGSLYGLGLTRTILSRPARVYQGVVGKRACSSRSTNRRPASWPPCP